MNRAIEQTLLSLLPAQNDDLPPQLVSLASSLLAQSRNRASTLKAEEEIARTYACAHIACDRLKITLNLPQIQPRPPIAPRIYKRLYNHLDTILPNNSSGVGTPRSAARVRAAAAAASGNPGSQQARTPSRGAGRFRDVLAASPSSTATGRVPGAQRPTPSQAESLARFRSSPTKTLWCRGTGNSKQLPWLRTVARYLCTALDVTRLVPFVFAGLDHVLLPPAGSGPPDAWAVENPAGLLAALVFFCMRALARANAALAGGGVGTEDEELDGEQYRVLEKALLKVWNRAREELLPGKETTEPAQALPGAADAGNAEAAGEGAGEPRWKGWRTLKPKDLKEALVVVTDKNWLDSDWFRGIQDMSHENQGADGDDGEHEQGGPVAQLWRADTMLQERYDLTSERRRRDFAVWKADVLQQIEHLERKGVVFMDICP
ncbi:hypothetical protein RB595_005285 [Gaeumannomyces hyphopodioides]